MEAIMSETKDLPIQKARSRLAAALLDQNLAQRQLSTVADVPSETDPQDGHITGPPEKLAAVTRAFKAQAEEEAARLALYGEEQPS
jgi:hypothetical protein